MTLPLFLGASGLLALVLLATGKAKAATVERKLADVVPSRKKKDGGSVAIVTFTPKKVFWRTNKKTGKKQYRVQIEEEPIELATRASEKLGRKISIDVFSLATMIASEVGSGADLAKAAVAHAALTYVKKHGKGKNLHEVLTRGDGRYGGQAGRYASTRNPPTLRDVEIAEAVAGGKISNPAPGAVQWDSPKAQDALVERGEPGYEMNSEELGEKREAEGKVAMYLPGVDQRYLRLWRAA